MEKTIKYFIAIFAMVFAATLLFGFAQNVAVFAEDENFEIETASSSIDYKNSTLYYTDVENKKIWYRNQNTSELQYFSTKNEKTPELLVADFDGNIYYTRVENIGLVDKDQNVIRSFGNDEIDIVNIYDLDCDISNNIYALCIDKTDKYHVLIKRPNSIFEIFCSLDGLTLNSQSKISVSLDKNYLVLYNQNNFYKVEQNSFSPLTEYNGLDTILESVKDIKLDYHNNLFVLTNQKLYKSTKDSITNYANEIFANTKTFELEYLTGEIFCVTNNKITKISSENFIDSLSTATIVDYKNTKQDCHLIKTTKNAMLYAYDNCIYTKTLNNENIVIGEDTTLCAIGEKTESDFYFVLLNNKTNENITGFIKCGDAQIIQTTEKEKSIIILQENTPLYTYPSSLDDSFKAKDENGDIVLSKNTTHTMKIQKFGSKDFKDVEFSQIVYNDKTYYIDTRYYIINTPSTINKNTAQAGEKDAETLNAQNKLTSGEIVGIVLISLTVIAGAILIVFTIKHKNKKEL